MLNRIESALERQFTLAQGPHAPPRLLAAMRHAVFPGGARIRPQLCLAVAAACSEDAPALSDAAAVAIELLHCASLAHDDMPCFDDADLRRGQPTVHKAWGQPLALLAGDSLIVMAFEALGQAAQACGPFESARLPALLGLVARSAGVREGIVGGQAWECEPKVDLGRYQQAKTGALFVASTCAGALAAGRPAEPWARLGECLGEAYQVADDIRDVLGDAASLGKPAGQDAQHHRPSAAAALGLVGAVQHFQGLMQEAVESVPECPSRESLRRLVRSESERLVPQTACDQLLREAGLARASSLAVAAGLAPAAGASAQTVRGVTG
jgi:geranylgeranyl diphosphate synthase type II